MMNDKYPIYQTVLRLKILQMIEIDHSIQNVPTTKFIVLVCVALSYKKEKEIEKIKVKKKDEWLIRFVIV